MFSELSVGVFTKMTAKPCSKMTPEVSVETGGFCKPRILLQVPASRSSARAHPEFRTDRHINGSRCFRLQWKVRFSRIRFGLRILFGAKVTLGVCKEAIGHMPIVIL